ncbi:MAG: hypothetical protein IT428_13200 [Planctomycetaceae bacterium]|nr:hypothetical protein [Planctomycetaceae bacterium]
MPTRKSIFAPWIAAVVLLVLIGGYVGAYCSTVQPRKGRPHFRVARAHLNRRIDRILTGVFAPVIWLDRQIRPHAWEPKP